MSLEEAQAILEISIENLNLQDLKGAFRRKAQQTHPDKGGLATDFIKVREAYNTLRDYLLNPQKTNFNDDFNSTGQSQTGPSSNYDQSQWQAQFYDLLHKYQQILETNQLYRASIHQYELQIKQIIAIFNTTQQNLQQIRESFNENLHKLDEVYNQAVTKLEKQRRQGWIPYILGQKKMSNQEFILRKNNIVEQINQHEQELMNNYHKDIQTTYQAAMDALYTILSQEP